MDNWRRWMKAGEGIIGYTGKSAGFVSGGNSAHFDDMVDAADLRCARTVDTLIRDLPPIQSAVIHHEYLNAVFRFRADYGKLLADAKANLERGLFTKGLW